MSYRYIYTYDFSKQKDILNSRDLRPGSKVCSEHMNDWQYLSQGDLEQTEFFPQK